MAGVWNEGLEIAGIFWKFPVLEICMRFPELPYAQCMYWHLNLYCTHARLLWERGQVMSSTFARGAYHITLLHQRVERPGLDGLIEQKISDQTVQVWLTRCQRGKSYVVRPARKKYDLTSLPQYNTHYHHPLRAGPSAGGHARGES